MTASLISLMFESVVAVLLAVMIFYAIKLNKRIGEMRRQEPELHALIEEFNKAANRADASAATLKAAGTQAESALKAQINKAQALRDELAFMADRFTAGNAAPAPTEDRSASGSPFGKRSFAAVAAAERAERSERGAARTEAPEVRQGYEGDEPDDPDQSRAERELIRAILSNQPAR